MWVDSKRYHEIKESGILFDSHPLFKCNLRPEARDILGTAIVYRSSQSDLNLADDDTTIGEQGRVPALRGQWGECPRVGSPTYLTY